MVTTASKKSSAAAVAPSVPSPPTSAAAAPSSSAPSACASAAAIPAMMQNPGSRKSKAAATLSAASSQAAAAPPDSEWTCAVCHRSMKLHTKESHLSGSDHKRKAIQAGGSGHTELANAVALPAASASVTSRAGTSVGRGATSAAQRSAKSAAAATQPAAASSLASRASGKAKLKPSAAATGAASAPEPASAPAFLLPTMGMKSRASVFRCVECRQDFSSREARAQHELTQKHKNAAKAQNKRKLKEEEAARKLYALMPPLVAFTAAEQAEASASACDDGFGSPNAGPETGFDCEHCFAPASGFRCSACPLDERAFYCSAACQRKEWHSHSDYCSALARSPPDSEDERQAEAADIYAEWYGADMGNSGYEGGD